jgi:uncharacterized repeat protein (TIGR01451 family)
MKLFHFTKTQKSSILSLMLGGFLLFGLLAPIFTDAAILVTGGGYVDEEQNDNWGIIVTGTGVVSTTTTKPSSTSSTSETTSHPLCHAPSCTTTTTRPHIVMSTTTTHPLCHHPDCHEPVTTTTTKPPTTTTTIPPTTTTTIPPTTTTTICPTVTTNIHTTTPSIPYNGSAILQWNSINANHCTVSASPYNSQWNSSVNLNGAKNISNLTKTTTFSITCSNSCGKKDTKSTIVYVQSEPLRYSCNTSTWQCIVDSYGPYTSLSACQTDCQPTTQPLSVSCYASPSSAQVNQTVTFYSNVSGGSGNYTHHWSGVASGNQSYSQRSFSNTGTQTAYPTVYDSQGKSASTSCNAYIDGGQCTNPPTVNLWADKYTINQEETTYLRWSSNNANYCIASNGWSGNKATSGYETISPNSDTTYHLTCYGYNNCGQVSQSVTIYVSSAGTNLSLTKLGRNLSAGGRVYSKAIQAAQGDVIEFYLTVSAGSNKDLYNVVVKDLLPTNLNYRPGTTKVDGITQADTIITTGLSLGTLNRGTTKNISFQAINTAPVSYLSYTNTAEVTADNENKVTDSATIIHGIVAGAATVVTGAGDYFLISLITSFILALIALYYVKFNTHGKMVLATMENKTRNAYLSYARYQINRKNK